GFGGAFHWPVPRPDTLTALRDEAHRRGLVFVVHANSADAWRAALDAGADVIAHGLWHWPGDMMGTAPPGPALQAIDAAARAPIHVQPPRQAVYGDESIFDAAMLDDPRLTQVLPPSVIAWLHGPEAQAGRRALADEYRGAIAQIFRPASPDPAAVM